MLILTATRVRVNAGAASSLAALPELCCQFQVVQPAIGLSKLVNSLTKVTTVDKTLPTVTIESSGLDMTTGNVKFTITPNDALATAVVSLGEITVVNGTKEDYDGSILTVKPTDPKLKVTVTVKADAIMDAEMNTSVKTWTYKPVGYVATVTITGHAAGASGTDLVRLYSRLVSKNTLLQ